MSPSNQTKKMCIPLTVERLERPNGEFLAYRRHDPCTDKSRTNVEIVFLGGFQSNMMTGKKAQFLLQWSMEEGTFAVTTFDYYGHGSSSGSFEKGGTISQFLDDTLAILDNVIPPHKSIILVGSSMGGWIMTLATQKRPTRIKGMIGLAPAPDFTDLIWKKLSGKFKHQLENEGRIMLPSQYANGGGYPISYSFIQDAKQHLLLQNHVMMSENLPIHLIHGTNDKVVPCKVSYDYLQAVSSKHVTVTLIKGGDHRLSSPRDLHRLQQAIIELQNDIFKLIPFSPKQRS